HLQRWGHVRLFSPFSMNHTSLGRAAILAEKPQHELPGDSACLTGKEHLAAYVEPLAKTRVLRDCLRTDTTVHAICRRDCLKEENIGDAKRGQQPFRLLVQEGKNRERLEEADV